MYNNRIIRIGFSALFIILFAIAILWANNIGKIPLINSSGKTYAKAEILEILSDNSAEQEGRAGTSRVKLKIESGEFKGEELEAYSTHGYLYGASNEKGTKVLAVISESDGEKYVTVGGEYRINSIILIGIVFLGSICLLGRKRGVLAAVGLVFTIIAVIWLFLPLVYRGMSPFAAAVITCALTTAVCMPLIGGITKKSAAAIISTVTGVVVAGLLAFLFGKLTGVSGYNVSEIDELMFIASNTEIKADGLLFAGILIASLGAVMDVGMSVPSAIEELHRKRQELTAAELFKSGMNVGRDMMGTMSNTLILAFAGTSINTLVTAYAYNYPAIYTMNLYSTCIEIIRGIAGSLGVIYTIPVAAAVAALFYGKKIRSNT